MEIFRFLESASWETDFQSTLLYLLVSPPQNPLEKERR